MRLWGCISFDSYIKPQLCVWTSDLVKVVYLLIPTSNHNAGTEIASQWMVVYLLIPTSNHNLLVFQQFSRLLYIFWFLHQTTTPWSAKTGEGWLYIFWFLHQTTTIRGLHRGVPKLYIFWFLHQTTTQTILYLPLMSCISFDSYIKPQPLAAKCISLEVVYLLIPTSNHNNTSLVTLVKPVVYLLIPTSNHNS